MRIEFSSIHENPKQNRVLEPATPPLTPNPPPNPNPNPPPNPDDGGQRMRTSRSAHPLKMNKNTLKDIDFSDDLTLRIHYCIK